MSHIIEVAETASTNSLMASMDAATPLAHGTAVSAIAQSAGRGQRGNTWESAPGMNLTFSLLLRPAIEARRQFAVSEAVALGVADTLRRRLPGREVSVKWPNDIYVGDRKICGILIENSLRGPLLERSIAGIGVNVNQTEFVSDAPNPVSLRGLTGEETPLRPLLEDIVDAILENIAMAGGDNLHCRYLACLWRREGIYRWSTPAGENFEAAIAGVLPDGRLALSVAGESAPRLYAFKEVAAVL